MNASGSFRNNSGLEGGFTTVASQVIPETKEKEEDEEHEESSSGSSACS